MSLTTIANDRHDSSAWLLFLEIGIPEVETIRIVQNNENITWGGNTWIALGIGDIDVEVSKGEIPSIQVTVPNANHIMSRYLSEYNSYIKAHGIEGNQIIVTFYVVPHKLILSNSNCEAAYSIATEYISCDITSKSAVITVGAFNIFNMPFPNLTIGMTCNFIFKNAQTCGYAGSETTCNKTLARCRELSNSSRFGGHAGVMPQGITVATS